jgi:UDP-hydrolysing UDP-N-acetyl-D-glucosamine 2-epimerase
LTPRRLTYLTGTRADFGVMAPILREIAASPSLELDLLVTGMHLSERFGATVREVEASALPISARIPVAIDQDSGLAMGLSAAEVLAATSRFLADNRREAFIVLGDRWEMLAAAQAALYAGLPVVHLCGGERSGSIDESLRHAISKLAHVHLVAAEDGERRLLGMGEEPWRIHRIGAPGLPGLEARAAQTDLATLAQRYDFDATRPYALLLFHPVVQDARMAGTQWRALFDALAPTGLQVVSLLPNADTGTDLIRAEIASAAANGRVVAVEHMPRDDYVSALSHAEFLIGNSSSGIVEAATLGTAVVNVGDRQAGRMRSANVFDADFEPVSLAAAIAAAREFDASGLVNVYGEAHADRRTREVLESLDFADPALLKKSMTY